MPVSTGDKLPDQRGADEACPPSDKNTLHAKLRPIPGYATPFSPDGNSLSALRLYGLLRKKTDPTMARGRCVGTLFGNIYYHLVAATAKRRALASPRPSRVGLLPLPAPTSRPASFRGD